MTLHSSIPFGLYRHTKTGRVYRVICTAENESAGDEEVVYRSESTGKQYTRWLSEWNEEVRPGKKRFEILPDDEQMAD